MLETAITTVSESVTPEQKKMHLIDVPVPCIFHHREQPRRIVGPEEIQAMMASLTTVGQMQPVGVRRSRNGWILVFGYLRLQAARQLGWKTIRAMEFPECRNSALLDLALWINQNLHQSMPKLDELAMAVNRLADAGMALPAIASALGKPEPWVETMLGIARDPLARGLIETGRLTGVDAWQAFCQMAPATRKTLLDSNEPVSVQRCLLAGQQPVVKPANTGRPKLVKPVVQANMEFDLFGEAGIPTVNASNSHENRSAFDFFQESDW